MQVCEGGSSMVFVKLIIKLIITSLTIICVIGVVLLAYFLFYVPFYQIPVSIEETGEKIYLKEKNISRNVTEVIISPHKGRKVKSKKDYVYTWHETLFYRIEGNTLYILCSHKAKIPPDFGKHVRIVQNTYSNLEYYDLINNYSQKGYQKFPLSKNEKMREKYNTLQIRTPS